MLRIKSLCSLGENDGSVSDSLVAFVHNMSGIFYSNYSLGQTAAMVPEETSHPDPGTSDVTFNVTAT